MTVWEKLNSSLYHILMEGFGFKHKASYTKHFLTNVTNDQPDSEVSI